VLVLKEFFKLAGDAHTQRLVIFLLHFSVTDIVIFVDGRSSTHYSSTIGTLTGMFSCIAFY